MSTYNLNINRSNFKQQRQCYNITVKEIADICNLAPQTVINFEKGSGKYTDTMSRDYNSDMMCQTLESLITKKLDEIKVKNLKSVIEEVKSVKKEDLLKKEHKRLGGLYAETDILRTQMVDYIRSYCKHNAIACDEFCSMCKINRAYTTPSASKREGKYVTIGVFNKITAATGWTKEQILAGFKPEKEMAFKLKLVDKKENDIPKHGDLVKKSDDTDVYKECTDVIRSNGGARLSTVSNTNQTISNVKYICENGKFYKEYDVIRHVVVDISKEDFLKEVSS